jgi:hypothetical protein
MKALAGWVALALLGLVIAGGASYAASRLVSEPVGISAEPLRAGQSLAAPSRDPVRTPTPTPRPKRTPTPTPTPAPAVDDHGGGDSSGKGRGRGRGSDDGGGGDD